MKKPFLQQFTVELNKQLEAFQRRMRRRKKSLKRAQRHQEVQNVARSVRAAREKKAKIRSVRRSAAQQVADIQMALRWDTVRRAMHQASKKTWQTVRKARVQSPVLRRWGFRLVLGIAACSLVANLVLYYRYSSSRPLVTIGHRVITKREYLANMDGAAGKAVLSKMVFGELINQAASKASLMPSEQEINTRLADLRRRTPGNVPAQDTPALRTEAGQMIALENLRIQNVTASDAEVAAYYNAHKNEYTLPPQAQATLVVAGNAADAGEAVHLLVQDMPESAIATHHGLRVAGVNGFQVNMNSLPPAVRGQLTGAVMQMKTGEIKTFTLGKIFLIFKVKSHDAGAVLPLSQVREQVARQVRLQKAPSEQEEMAALYHGNKPFFDMAIYQNFFSDLDTAPAKSSNEPKTASLP